MGYSDLSRQHHYKELVVRGIIGGVIGNIVSNKMYGMRQTSVEPEVASNPQLREALQDEDSLQFAEYTRRR